MAYWGLSDQVLNRSPQWIRFLNKTKYISWGAGIWIVCTVVSAIALPYKTIHMENPFGRIVLLTVFGCLVWLFLRSWTIQFCLLYDSWKNHREYFSRMLFLGIYVWDKYKKNYLKPRLSNLARENMGSGLEI